MLPLFVKIKTPCAMGRSRNAVLTIPLIPFSYAVVMIMYKLDYFCFLAASLRCMCVFLCVRVCRGSHRCFDSAELRSMKSNGFVT
jgi:hypothetical protein